MMIEAVHRIADTVPRQRAGGIDRTKGACNCWICRRAYPGVHERNWLAQCLARDLARKPDAEREVWLANYALRHGPIITRQLRDAIEAERRATAGSTAHVE